MAQASDEAATIGILIAIGYLGLMVYLIVRFIEVANNVRDIKGIMQWGSQQGSETRSRRPMVTSSGLDVARLREISELHKDGVLTDAEFADLKAALLGDASTSDDPEPDHPDLRITAYSYEWALGQSETHGEWVIVNQRTGVRERFVSVDQAREAFEERTGGKHVLYRDTPL